MFAAVRTNPAFAQRVRTMIVAGLLALSLLAGASATATQVDARKRQPNVVCDHYSPQEWYFLTQEISGPGGYWDCNFA